MAMTISDFQIGLEFLCGPFWYRCTDIGTRTVAAIRLVEDDPVWYQGPPYLVNEHVLDENDLAEAFLNEQQAIAASIVSHQTSGHPGYGADVVERMMVAKLLAQDYPLDRRILRFDRVSSGGEILHPYAVRNSTSPTGEEWLVLLYLPFTQQWREMWQMEFISYPVATPEDVLRCSNIS